MNLPVRDWIEDARYSWDRNQGWKKVGIGFLVFFLICVFLVVGTVILLVWLVRALAVGGVRNKDLYLPGKFINKDLYIPRRR